MRATARLAGCSINTVVRLLIEAGRTCTKFQDSKRGVKIGSCGCPRCSSDFAGRVVSTVVSEPMFGGDSHMKLEARGIEPLSSSLSTQTSTCLSGDKF